MYKFITIAALRDKMEDKPKAQRLYRFFEEDHHAITEKQINELEKIINEDYSARKKYIKLAKEKRRKERDAERSVATGAQ